MHVVCRGSSLYVAQEVSLWRCGIYGIMIVDWSKKCDKVLDSKTELISWSSSIIGGSVQIDYDVIETCIILIQ